MSIQFLEYQGRMITVTEYIALTEGVKKPAKIIEAKKETKPELKESTKEAVNVVETKRKPGLPTKAEIKKALDENKIQYTEANCWATLYKKFQSIG